MMRRLRVIVLFAMLLPIGIVSCTRDNYADERSVRLEFSDDVVCFDTVFATLGTATRQVRVYNRTATDIELSTVTLKHGRQSRFRLNVDGDTSLVARRVELQAGDSLFIFIQANIDPNNEAEPFLRTDSILFGNGQVLKLEAYGRNAVYHRLKPTDTTWFVPIDCAAWRHDRPHVFLDPAAVLDGNTLTLLPGDKHYFADRERTLPGGGKMNTMLIIDSNATLVAQGTAAQPVLFTSLRHEPWYDSLPGQWQTVWFYNYSTGNVMDYCVVENGEGGIRCYPGSQLTVSNTVVRSMSDAGIIGQHATIEGSNLLVYDCFCAMTLIAGGNYRFNRCTFADYWNYIGQTRDTAAVIVSNYYPVDGVGYVAGDLERADFTDCIVYGTWSRGEMAKNPMDGFTFNCNVVHSIVRGGDWDEDPQFVDPARNNYRLKSGSPAAGIGYQFN